jgi:lysophospholipase L1-like esterase
MSERVVLCYGDSNTYGWDAATGRRFPPDTRWPGVLAASLGPVWRVIEEGLGGRTTVHDDPLLPHRNGLTYLTPCLESHAPLDLVVLSLGVNDLKPRFGVTATDVARGVGRLTENVLGSGTGPDWSAPRVLVLGLPRLGPLPEPAEDFAGAREKAARLPAALAGVTEQLGVELLDLAEVATGCDLDGVHLDADAHRAIGEAVARRIGQMF